MRLLYSLRVTTSPKPLFFSLLQNYNCAFTTALHYRIPALPSNLTLSHVYHVFASTTHKQYNTHHLLPVITLASTTPKRYHKTSPCVTLPLPHPCLTTYLLVVTTSIPFTHHPHILDIFFILHNSEIPNLEQFPFIYQRMFRNHSFKVS